MTRIVSLLPAATEMVCAVGAGDSLVGISHECDYPASITGLPRVTVTPIDQAKAGIEIDAEVRRLRSAGLPVIGVDAKQLRALSPDVILTQDLCEVCAVADGAVHRLVRAHDAARLISLQARDVQGIWQDIRTVGAAVGRQREAADLVAVLEQRLAGISAGRPAPGSPRVVCVEWLDPLYLAGHWVPQMIEAAGGEDVGAAAGSHSVVSNREEVLARRPDVVIVAICGFGLERAFKELSSLADNHWLHTFPGPVWVLDGNAFTSRPGPRVVQGAELIQSALRGIERPGVAKYENRSADDADSLPAQADSLP